MDLPDSDRGDFSCRRAVDSSSYVVISHKMFQLQKYNNSGQILNSAKDIPQYGPVTMIVPASRHQVRCIPWVQMGAFNKEIGFLCGLKFFALNIFGGEYLQSSLQLMLQIWWKLLPQYGPVTMIVPASRHQVRCIPWVQMGAFNKEIGFLCGLKFFALNIFGGEYLQSSLQLMLQIWWKLLLWKMGQ